MFLLGEIDCREGLLIALERDKFDDLSQAIEATVDIFITVLTNIIHSAKFKVLLCDSGCDIVMMMM